jgi:tRNA threonylcarbamoyladenosine biosynthesis protein TsaB
MQNAVGVGLAAEELAAEGKTVSAQELVPVYLRLSQAERERLAKGLKITVD